MSQLVEQGGLPGAGGFRCGDGEALMTYVYGESSPAERDAIAAHVARCVACTDEIQAIGSTRAQLAAWVPPTQTLGFQISRRMEPIGEGESATDSAPPVATILRPAAWWHRPLPAWAQMAAAAVIFVSGLAIGMARGAAPAAGVAGTVVGTVAQGGQAKAVEPVAVTLSTVTPSTVTREELARVEQRLKSEIAQVRTAAPAVAEPSNAMMQRVNQMIAASERRQLQELNFRTAQIVTDVADRRTVDMYNIERRFGATTSKVLGNQQDINSLAQRVGYMPANSPYVP